MLEKLVIFGIGYVLGTRAGKERFDEMVETLGRGDVDTAQERHFIR